MATTPKALATAIAAPDALRLIPLSQLVEGDNGDHARKTAPSKEQDASLKAHIEARGIIVPLVVHSEERGKETVYKVRDGNRRLRLMRELAADREAPDVPCVVVANGSAMDDSLATATLRATLHPVDEYEAYAYLVDKEGETPDSIAKRYGVKILFVRQRLALGRLSPRVRDLWRAGKIAADVAEAFTLGATHEAQDAVLADLTKARSLARYSVRSAFLGDSGAASAYLRLVGKKEYEAAGGGVIEDLFTADRSVTDFPLLQKMVDAKIAAEAERLVADGWAWAAPETDPALERRYMWERVTPRPEYTKAETARLKAKDLPWDEQEAIQHAARMRAFGPGQKAKSGVVITINDDGAMDLEGGFIKPAAAKASEVPAADRKAEKKKAAAKGEVSNALEARLQHAKRAAVKAAVAKYGAASKFPLTTILARMVADMIETGNVQSSGYLMPTEVRNGIDSMMDAVAPDVMLAELRKAFDAADYFGSCGRELCILAIRECDSKQDADALGKAKKADLLATAQDEARNTGWLPKQLRPAAYGAGGKSKPASRPARKVRRGRK